MGLGRGIADGVVHVDPAVPVIVEAVLALVGLLVEVGCIQAAIIQGIDQAIVVVIGAVVACGGPEARLQPGGGTIRVRIIDPTICIIIGPILAGT